MPLERLTVFVDRSLGSKRFVARLRALGIDAIAHDERFSSTASDAEWLTEAGANGWVVITKDKSIRWRPLEKEAFTAAGTRVFAFAQGNQTMTEMLEVFERALPRIERTLSEETAPFVATIAGSGAVTVIYPPEKRRTRS